MKKGSRMFMMAVSLPLFVLLSCNFGNAEKQREFYYYPEKNVYYNVAKSVYLYSVDGAKTWQAIAANTNETNNTTLGQKIVIYSSSDSIWLDNTAHRGAAGGKLYNIATPANEDTSTGWVKEKKVIKKPVVVKTQKNKDKPKKGIGKFFEKLFGKQKKDTTTE